MRVHLRARPIARVCLRHSVNNRLLGLGDVRRRRGVCWLAEGGFDGSDTLAYGHSAIGVASLVWGLGEACVDAGLGVHELWLCSRDGRCHDATVAVV